MLFRYRPQLSNLRTRAHKVLEKYGLVLAGAAIFAYYLWSTIDLFATFKVQRDPKEYFFHFDSLILLWLLLFVGWKFYQHKKKEKEEVETSRRIAIEVERQKMRLDLLDEVTALLSDTVNNPLAVISISAESIRSRFATDRDVLAFLDVIDGALKRMREVLSDFQTYHMKKIVKSFNELPSNPKTASSLEKKSSHMVSAKGEIHEV
jgi:signal transduction histidine kinase